LFAAGQACVSNSDCASQVCNKFYYDGDGDGYPVSASSIGFCSTTSSPSSGYIPARSDGKWDCCDTDAGAHPGVTDYFSTKDVCGNFDWDCSGTEEKQSVHQFTRCVADTVNSTCSQTTSDNPPTADCGATWTGVTMCQITITSGQVACYPRTSGGTVTCH
jgi:hypothetical protein